MTYEWIPLLLVLGMMTYWIYDLWKERRDRDE